MSDDLFFRALADPTRRKILDLLRDRPRTTGELCDAFSMSRFGVMKHLKVLESAALVTHETEGRVRTNFLNVTPIREIYERWVHPYQRMWDGPLSRLKRHVEGRGDE
jgi:DNA-binding transcriptional ArsR family regulator